MNLQHSSVPALKSIESCQEFLSHALKMCSKFGATDAYVSFQQDIGFGVDVRMGVVDSVSFHQSQGLDVEVYIGQRKGLATSTDLRLESIEKVIKAAVDMAKVSAEDPYYGLVIPSKLDKRDLDLFHPWAIQPEQAIREAIDLEDLARGVDKRIVNSNGTNVGTYSFLTASMNTKGFEDFVYSSRHHRSCSLLAQQNDEMQTDYAYTTARRHEDLDGLEELGHLAAKRVCDRLGSRRIETQKIPVIFSNRVSAELIGHFLGAIHGGQIYRKNSFLCDSIGQKLFPEFVDMQEFPHIPRGLASSLYDSDGLATRENRIVEQGILKQYILSVYSARRLGLQPSGNADGVHNLQVQANAKGLDDLISQMHKGFLITDLMGQGVNLLTGDYSRGAAGFWIENGKVQYPVEGVTVAGNLKNIYQNIGLIGNDHDKNRATKCGSILVQEMMVAGS